MKFALASYGTRGDVEPCAAIGRELLRRGHEVRMAVPHELVDFVESAGLATVAFGPDLDSIVDAACDISEGRMSFRNFWKLRNQGRLLRLAREIFIQTWRETTTTLIPLADGADLLLTGLYYEEPAANVAEYHGIPFATLHLSPVRDYYPIRANSQLLPFLPWPLIRSAMTVNEWGAYWRMTKKLEDAQRCELGLPKVIEPCARRITKRGALEIQGYDEVCFSELAAEWAAWHGQRPFVGTLTLDLATEADEEVSSWVAAGPPPICFSFGSIAVESPSDTVEMISKACAQLGERALICSAGSDFSGLTHSDKVKVVGAVNYSTIFPACRAVVHHGGAGTTAAGLRAGVPTLVLWTVADQPMWGLQVKRLKVGTARSFSTTNGQSLVADLRQILTPEYAARAREIATRMTAPSVSVSLAADLVENYARLRRRV